MCLRACHASPERLACACSSPVQQVKLPRLFVGMQQLTSLKIIGSTGSVLDPSRDLPVAAQHLTALRSLSYTGRVLALPSSGFDLQPGMLPPTLQVCAPDTPTRFKPTAAAPCCVCACRRLCCLGSSQAAPVPPVHRSHNHIVNMCMCGCHSVSVALCLPPGSHTCCAAVRV